MIASLLFVIGSVCSHTSAARILPASLKILAPSIGWFLTSTVLRTRYLSVYIGLQSLLGAAAVLTLSTCGLSLDLAKRTLYFPTLGGALGGLVGTLLAHYGYRAHIVATIIVSVLQLWASLGGVVILAVYPASVMQAMETQGVREARFREAVRYLSARLDKTVERSVTVALNGLQLDTVIVKSTQHTTQKWMIYFGGNGEFLENTIADVSRQADMFDVNLVLFNPRGVGRSNGYVSQVSDLVEDAAAVAQYVVKKENIKPRQLVLFGHSIGGGVAAQVAYRVFPDATLVLDRTFSSLVDAASSFSPLTPTVTQLLFPLLVGDLNSVEAWNGLQHDRRLILFSRLDEIISYTESSIARLPQFQPGQPDAKHVLELHGSSANTHNIPINDFDERGRIASYVKQCLGR